jgi:hypothetical protein
MPGRFMVAHLRVLSGSTRNLAQNDSIAAQMLSYIRQAAVLAVCGISRSGRIRIQGSRASRRLRQRISRFVRPSPVRRPT